MSPPPIKYNMLIQKDYKIKIGEKKNKLSYNLPDHVEKNYLIKKKNNL